MHTIRLLLALVLTTGISANCPPFPSSVIEFSSSFQQPEPPLVKPEYNASFVQHKWNGNLSHITTGYIVNSPGEGIVRVAEAFDGNLASSVFDYANVTEDGLVNNVMKTYSPDSDKPDVWEGYVNSNYPIFTKDFLQNADAVFAGLLQRRFVGQVAAWDIMYQGVVPVTVYVSSCREVVGFDYFSPDLRTRVITEYFNIEAA